MQNIAERYTEDDLPTPNGFWPPPVASSKKILNDALSTREEFVSNK